MLQKQIQIRTATWWQKPLKMPSTPNGGNFMTTLLWILGYGFTTVGLILELLEIQKKYIHALDLNDNAINEMEKAQNARNYWREEYIKSTSETKADLIEQNKRLKLLVSRIRVIAQLSDMPPCLEVDCDCKNCYDEVTQKGTRCMEYGLNNIWKLIEQEGI